MTEPLYVAISKEIGRARTKFPHNRHLLAALIEEVGELAQAILQAKPDEEIRKEAIQVCAVAIRIIKEGDADFDGWTEADGEGLKR